MVHQVVQGEHLSMIAEKYGFSSYRTLWNHPQNAALKKLRKNPNILFPGDSIFIPDLETRSESRPTEQRHTFKKMGDKLMLRLVVKDENGEPVANTPCRLLIEPNDHAEKTDGLGMVEVQVHAYSQKGTLIISNIEMPLKIGDLDPVTEPSGQVARLNNLGYRASPADGFDEKAFRSAVEEFQCDHPPLKVNGVCGGDTQAKLVEVHGC